MPPDVREFRERDRIANAIGRVIRRVLIKASSQVLLWQLTGYQDDDGNVETFDAEVFHNVGSFGRPPAGRGDAVIVLTGGASGSPVVVATRDRATLSAVLSALGGGSPDEALLYNSKSVVYVKEDGTIEARSVAGVATKLPTFADIDAIWRYLYAQFSSVNGHVHVVAGAATTTQTAAPVLSPPSLPQATPPTVVAAAPVGTQKLKGE